jgi:sugar O-acyltransferase (sialic acid O-acetyltransferase NeuD family)
MAIETYQPAHTASALVAEDLPLLFVGAGGHARVVADAALLSRRWPQVHACDRDPARASGALLPGVPLLTASAAGALVAGVHVAIGDNLAREREAAQWGHDRLVSVLHPSACVSSAARLGAGCFVAAGAIVAAGAELGICVIVNHAAVVDHDVSVGAFSHIAPNATLGGAVRIGQRVLVGAGAVVLPGLAIADDVVIGAGAVVCQALPVPGTYVGVPARRTP